MKLQAFLPSLLGALACKAAAVSSAEKACAAAASHIDFTTYNATYLNATYHEPGDFSLTGPTGNLTNKVSFCELHASVQYAEGAELVFSVWLPDTDNYKARFLGIGNGGYGGTINRVSMLDHLNLGLGFAVAGGDAGHDAWAESGGIDTAKPGQYVPFLNYDERVKAWIHNAISIFTPLAKELVTKYYDQEPDHAYFNGCSAGGGQAFALAQYHPDLYDGIIAGSPGNYQSHMWLSLIWTFQAQQGDAALPAEVLLFVQNAVLELCDAANGVTDGVVENPLACPFKIQTLACAANEEPVDADGSIKCLSAAQVKAFQAIYKGAQTSDTNEQIYPGFNVGAETNWIVPATVRIGENFAVPILQNAIFKDLDWDYSTLNYTSDEVAFIDKRGAPLANAIGTDLSTFQKRGGRLITTMGWADPVLAPKWAIEHYARLQAALPDGEKLDDFARLFMIPGGGHCESVSFPQTPANWHVMAPLVEWVEGDVGPDEVLASDPADGSGRTRKLCSWPATAKFVGDDEDDWESYECVVEKCNRRKS